MEVSYRRFWPFVQWCRRKDELKKNQSQESDRKNIESYFFSYSDFLKIFTDRVFLQQLVQFCAFLSWPKSSEQIDPTKCPDWCLRWRIFIDSIQDLWNIDEKWALHIENWKSNTNLYPWGSMMTSWFLSSLMRSFNVNQQASLSDSMSSKSPDSIRVDASVSMTSGFTMSCVGLAVRSSF